MPFEYISSSFLRNFETQNHSRILYIPDTLIPTTTNRDQRFYLKILSSFDKEIKCGAVDKSRKYAINKFSKLNSHVTLW